MSKPLTIEEIAKGSGNLFDLVNYAIELARSMIRSGRECRVFTDVRNPAYQILLEIKAGKDSVDPMEGDVKKVELIQVEHPASGE